MLRYNDYLLKDKEGGWVMYEDVKTTAIMNFNLLEQIRERDARIKELDDTLYYKDIRADVLERKIIILEKKLNSS